MSQILYLRPSKRRLSLLLAVDAGRVVRTPLGSLQHYPESGGTFREVSWLIDEMDDAGWVYPDTGYWRLTDAGRAVLAQADAKEQT